MPRDDPPAASGSTFSLGLPCAPGGSRTVPSITEWVAIWEERCGGAVNACCNVVGDASSLTSIHARDITHPAHARRHSSCIVPPVADVGVAWTAWTELQSLPLRVCFLHGSRTLLVGTHQTRIKRAHHSVSSLCAFPPTSSTVSPSPSAPPPISACLSLVLSLNLLSHPPRLTLSTSSNDGGPGRFCCAAHLHRACILGSPPPHHLPLRGRLLQPLSGELFLP